MNRTLLFAVILFGCFFTNAQILFSENFNDMTIGNFGTQSCHASSNCGDFNPPAACYSQNGWLFSTVDDYSDLQIVNEDDIRENVLKLTSVPNYGVFSFDMIWRDDFDAIWAGRIPGNDIIEVEFDLFLPPPVVNTHPVYVWLGIWDDCGNDVVNMAINQNNNTFGSYTTLTENTWHRIGYAYNVNTGLRTYKGPGFYVNGNSTITDNEIVNLYFGIYQQSYSEETEAKIDNIVVRATDVENLLAIDEAEVISDAIKMYPNPVKDILKIDASSLFLSKIEIIDINGRLLKSIPSNNQYEVEVNVSDLNAGIYMVNIYSENTKTMKKFVKN